MDDISKKLKQLFLFFFIFNKCISFVHRKFNKGVILQIYIIAQDGKI